MITLKLDTEISNVTIQLELSKDQIYQQEQKQLSFRKQRTKLKT